MSPSALRGGFGKYSVTESDQPYEAVDSTRNDKTDTTVIRFGVTKRVRPVSMRIGASFTTYEQAKLRS